MKKDFKDIADCYNECELNPDDFPDFDLKKAEYQVWEFPRDENDDLLARGPILLWTSDDPDDAIAHAKNYIANLNKREEKLYYDEEAHHLTIEVETVIEIEEDEYTENIGSIFEADINLDED